MQKGTDDHRRQNEKKKQWLTGGKLMGAKINTNTLVILGDPARRDDCHSLIGSLGTQISFVIF